MRVCLVYPNLYSLGMTNLGFQSVYRLFNDIDGCVCERAFLPDRDDIKEHSRTETPIFSLESQTDLREFDIIAFSVPFEDDYLNIPAILNLAGVPVFSHERKSIKPLVIAGGVAVSLNPEPLADMIDLFLIGEGEGAAWPFIEAFAGARGPSKEGLLKELDALDFTYAPSLYEFDYDGPAVAGVRAAKGAKAKVKASKDFDLDRYPIPENFIITPDTEFRDTFLTEIERGCGRGCRFCAAGFLYLPPRWRDFEAVKNSVKKGIKATGKVGLVGTAVSEYPDIKELLSYGVEMDGSMTLSSLRLDRLDAGLMGLLKKSGYKTVTLAPEAGTERMRNIVNKGIRDGDILESVRLITEAGFYKIKLYFLIGLPAENDDDARAIVELSRTIKGIMKKGELTLSVNPFIPKPFTPFQWHGFEDPGVVDRRLEVIKKGVSKEQGVLVKALSAKEALGQAYISRADRRAGRIIAEAAGGWKKAARRSEDLIGASAGRQRDKGETLPWDIIDHGISKNYLWKEYQKGLKGALTPPCEPGSCFRCGVCRPELFN